MSAAKSPYDAAKTPYTNALPPFKLAEVERVPIPTDCGGAMARRIRFVLVLFFVSLALSAAACADASGPSSEACDHNNPIGCR